MSPSPLPTRPRALRPGDTISLVAPASSPQAEQVSAAVAAIEEAGFQTKLYRDLCQPDGYLAGDDASRSAELNQALTDPESSAVFAVRGGYGVVRLLERLDYAEFAKRPKIVAGYSDITALHAALMVRCGWVTLHSPNAIDLAPERGDAQSTESLWRLATGAGAPATLASAVGHPSMHALVSGKAVGPLVGGNLAVLTGLVGTPYNPIVDGCVLFFEDTGEAPYRIDRLLAQLSLTGDLARVAGVAVGHLSDCGEDDSAAVEKVLERYLAPLDVPVLLGLPVGHEAPNLAFPIGVCVELDAEAGRIALLEPCFA